MLHYETLPLTTFYRGRKLVLISDGSFVDDLADLVELSDPAILHETRHRYYNQFVYTNVGSDILLAVNPHRSMKIYDGKNAPW